MNIFKRFRKWQLEHIELPNALDDLSSLEKHQDFISPFFSGETAYPILRDENYKNIDKAKAKYQKLQKELKGLRFN